MRSSFIGLLSDKVILSKSLRSLGGLSYDQGPLIEISGIDPEDARYAGVQASLYKARS